MKQIDELQKKLEAAVQARFADDAINGTYNIARLLITACRERDEAIARLRERLTEWVERLRWADGLTDVVEQMRSEAER